MAGIKGGRVNQPNKYITMKADLEQLMRGHERQVKKPSTRKHPKPTKPVGRGFA